MDLSRAILLRPAFFWKWTYQSVLRAPTTTITDAISKFIEFIYDALNSLDYEVGVFMDLRKAFGTVDQIILLSKLHRYWIRGTSLSLIGSYLSGREQRVRIGNVLSNKI